MQIRDIVRHVVVAVSAVIAVVGSFIGSGAAGGTPIAEAAGGALGADATLIAPAGPAFSIWSVIYVGLVAYAVWQLLPAQRTDARQRTLGYPIAATLILNAAWILSIQAGLLPLSAIIIVLLLLSLVYAFALALNTRATGARRQGIVETLLVDATIGLYLGWVSIATAANLTSFLQTAGFRGFGWSATLWGVLVVGVAGLIGVLVAFWSKGRFAPAASLAWGLVWVAVSRITGSLDSGPVAATAVIAATAVVLVTLVVRATGAAHTEALRSQPKQ
ncbi:tryptophan-rich sensory protein [Subtercola vilae]|uniref:tryptophan-rich sensory protein n=1 Tax=Subtercola vilae TaxID=2056433 RepID=UPI00268CC927